MITRMRRRFGAGIALAAAATLAALALAPSAWACATCFGASDSNLVQGMNVGILSLLGVILSVLGTMAAFFIYLARRAARVQREAALLAAAETAPVSPSVRALTPAVGSAQASPAPGCCAAQRKGVEAEDDGVLAFPE